MSFNLTSHHLVGGPQLDSVTYRLDHFPGRPCCIQCPLQNPVIPPHAPSSPAAAFGHSLLSAFWSTLVLQGLFRPFG